jgi:hypothetical protein
MSRGQAAAAEAPEFSPEQPEELLEAVAQEPNEDPVDETALDVVDSKTQLAVIGGLGAVGLLLITVVQVWLFGGRGGLGGIGLGFWTFLVLAAGLAVSAGVELMLALKRRWALTGGESLAVGIYGFLWCAVFLCQCLPN